MLVTIGAALDVLQMRLNQSGGGVQRTSHLPYDSRCSAPEKEGSSHPTASPGSGEAATESPFPVRALKTAPDSQMAPISKGAHSPPATLSSGPAPHHPSTGLWTPGQLGPSKGKEELR